MNDQDQIPLSRVFKIGATHVVETESMFSLTNEQIRELLKISYPEVANVTLREREENGLRVVELLPQPGRKG